MTQERHAAYLSDVPVIPGNQVQFLVGGHATYTRMLEAIAAAQRVVQLETYTFASDATGELFVKALAERAQAGVQVRVMLDGVGSLTTPNDFFEGLKAVGGEVCWFRPVNGWNKNIYVRDHRKILVVDDTTAFIGGLNIANAYAPKEWGGQGWHDMHARVHGPAAAALARITARSWKVATGNGYEPKLAEVCGNTDVQILESRPVGVPRRAVRRAYLHAIDRAQKSVCIANAYCVPDFLVRRALYKARRRGVQVQMLMAGKSDVPAVQMASRHLYKRLLKNGIEIFEWDNQVLHAKTAVIDRTWCSIGSCNLDNRSLRHNLEANIACVDEELGTAMQEQFDQDTAQSRRIDPQTWHRRHPLQKLLEALFYQLRYLL